MIVLATIDNITSFPIEASTFAEFRDQILECVGSNFLSKGMHLHLQYIYHGKQLTVKCESTFNAFVKLMKKCESIPEVGVVQRLPVKLPHQPSRLQKELKESWGSLQTVQKNVEERVSTPRTTAEGTITTSDTSTSAAAVPAGIQSEEPGSQQQTPTKSEDTTVSETQSPISYMKTTLRKLEGEGNCDKTKRASNAVEEEAEQHAGSSKVLNRSLPGRGTGVPVVDEASQQVLGSIHITLDSPCSIAELRGKVSSSCNKRPPTKYQLSFRDEKSQVAIDLEEDNDVVLFYAAYRSGKVKTLLLNDTVEANSATVLERPSSPPSSSSSKKSVSFQQGK